MTYDILEYNNEYGTKMSDFVTFVVDHKEKLPANYLYACAV
jgi:hypothetical protein